MTISNATIKPRKDFLLNIVGQHVYINRFEVNEWNPLIPSGNYFIDSIIFHHSGQVEVGVSEYRDGQLNGEFDLDDCHIDYFDLDKLDIHLPDQPRINI